jgi:hypothetical protein
MKNLLFLILLSIGSTVATAQFDGIANAISSKDAVALSKFFDANVEITTPDQDAVFAKAEAVKVIQSFFTKYSVSSFSLEHQGASKGKSSEYAIGNMVASGKRFRVFIYVSETTGKTIIQQIQFEQD